MDSEVLWSARAARKPDMRGFFGAVAVQGCVSARLGGLVSIRILWAGCAYMLCCVGYGAGG